MDYAENEMHLPCDGQHQLEVWATTGQQHLKTLLDAKGYHCKTAEPAMEKTAARGARYCFGSQGQFYESMGFEVCQMRELWVKRW